VKWRVKVNTRVVQDACFVRPGEVHMTQVSTLTVETVEAAAEEDLTSGPVDRGS